MGIGTLRGMQDPGSGPVINSSGASPAGQDMMSYADNVNSSVSVLGKRENQDVQMSPLPNFNKKGRPTPVGLDGMQQQQIGPHIDGLTGSDINWKNSFLQSQVMARGISYADMPIQKFTHQVLEGALNQDAGTMPFAAGQRGMRRGAKEEPFEIDKFDGSELNHNKNDMPMVETETSHLESQQSQQRLPYPLMRSNFPQMAWNNLGPHVEKDARKEDQLQKRKSVQSPRISLELWLNLHYHQNQGSFLVVHLDLILGQFQQLLHLEQHKRRSQQTPQLLLLVGTHLYFQC